MQTVVTEKRHPNRLRPARAVPAARRLRFERLELLLVVGLAAIYLLWVVWPQVWSASANIRLVGAFNTDEEAHLILLREAIDAGSPRLGYIQYGYAYLNMGLFPLLLLSFVTTISDQQIIVWLRLIATLFAVGTLGLTFALTRRYFGRFAAWLATLLLAVTVLNFLEMAAMSHADMPQLFFIMLSLAFCCRLSEDHQWSWLIWAAAAAGLAFGCKYSGLFVLPLIGLTGLLHTLQLDPNRLQLNRRPVLLTARALAGGAGLAGLGLALVIIPRAAAPYAGAEYFGVYLPDFFAAFRRLALGAAVGLLSLALTPAIWRWIDRRPKLVYLLKLGLLSAGAFGLAFFSSAPFNIFSIRAGFMRGFLYESLHSGFGHSFQAEINRQEWFTLLLSPRLLDPLIFGLALLGLVLAGLHLWRSGWRGLLQPEALLWGWVLFYFGFLVWRVNIRTHRALLPIIPFGLILAAHAAGQLRRGITRHFSSRTTGLVTLVMIVGLAGLVLPPALGRLGQFRQTAASREQTSDAVQAGRWLAAHYPASTRVLYDPFSYVPPAFADAHVTPWGGTLALLTALDPAVVIINDYNANRFADMEQAGNFDRDEAHFQASYAYYQALKQEQAGYRLAQTFGEVQVYVKQPQ